MDSHDTPAAVLALSAGALVPMIAQAGPVAAGQTIQANTPLTGLIQDL